MNENDTAARLATALREAADVVPDRHPHPGIASLRPVPTNGRNRRWLTPAIAAAAVCLAAGVPYGLLHKAKSQDPVPATTAPTIAGPPPFVVDLVINDPGNQSAELVVLRRSDATVTDRIPVPNPGFDTVARDRKTFYVTSHDGDCDSQLLTFTVGQNGQAGKLVSVPGSYARGEGYADLALSPDGRYVAFTLSTQDHVSQSFCSRPSNGARWSVGVLDLTTGQRRVWSAGTGFPVDQARLDSWPAWSNLTWTLDGRHLVVPVESGTGLATFDPRTPRTEGSLSAVIEPINLDPAFVTSFPADRPSLLDPVRATGRFTPGTMAYLTGKGSDFIAGYHELAPGETFVSLLLRPYRYHLVRVDPETGAVTRIGSYRSNESRWH